MKAHSDRLQLLKTSVGNVIRFRKKTDYDKMLVITFLTFRSTPFIMDLSYLTSYLTGKGHDSLILLFLFKDFIIY